MDSDWFLFNDKKRRPFQKQNWIPLRASVDYKKGGNFGDKDYIRDTFSCGSVAIPIEHRDLGDKLGWSEIGLHETRSFAGEGPYKPADTFRLDWSEPEPNGVSLVIAQHFSWADQAIWHLHPDLVIALGLKREGDIWVRPDENYIDVVRLHRNHDDDPNLIEIRTEFLRDYLKARQMALRIAWYRNRDAILESADDIWWKDEPPSINENHYRFETRVDELHEGSGMPFGGQTAVFTAGRTDVDVEDDVPEFGPETDGNTYSNSRTFGQRGKKVFRVEGEIWAEEWVEPGSHSPRVGDDHPPSAASFIVDTSGSRESADVLDNEDVGKYLWFRPDVVNDILSRRGGKLGWFTRYTGSVELVFGCYTPFGINDKGLLNTYAYDVAKLPEWQRLIWQGYNVAPDGGVCAELLSAQMECRPAGTLAPERHLSEALKDVSDLFIKVFGEALFREHGDRPAILKTLHRFRAVQPHGLFDLAKDVTRVITEDIDTKALHRIAPPEKENGRGSLKSLERVIADHLTDEDRAADLLSFLHAIYDLRGMTSHLPSSAPQRDAFRMLGISQTVPTIEQGRELLNAVMYFLAELVRQLQAKASQASS